MEEKETIQPIEITWEELQSRDLERYILVDTRGDEAVNYGMPLQSPNVNWWTSWLRQQGIKK